ncbi:hypothetical protein ACYJ1Y_06895 [Natrialbaceae archaeon A-gly3]
MLTISYRECLPRESDDDSQQTTPGEGELETVRGSASGTGGKRTITKRRSGDGDCMERPTGDRRDDRPTPPADRR